MLIRSSVNTMLMLWKRKDNEFSRLPLELILAIKHSPTPDKDFLESLHNTAFAELAALKTTLEEAKAEPNKKDLMRLLLQAADVTTPAGKLIKNVTLLECALGAGDIEMAEMIKPYFDEFEGGKKEFERQCERYRSCIEAMTTQQHDYDITWLIEIIKESPLKDVDAERTTSDEYDLTYQSPLRTAMNKFRNDMLDPKRRIIEKPRMHCNYKNFDHVDKILSREWGNLPEEKRQLIGCQIYGLIELLELPAYERCVFVQDNSKAAIAGQPINRSFNFSHPAGVEELNRTFPVFSQDILLAHSGFGFDSWVTILGNNYLTLFTPSHFRSHIEQKQERAQTFMPQTMLQPVDSEQSGCVIL